MGNLARGIRRRGCRLDVEIDARTDARGIARIGERGRRSRREQANDGIGRVGVAGVDGKRCAQRHQRQIRSAHVVLGDVGRTQEQLDTRGLSAGAGRLIGEHGYALFVLAEGGQRTVEFLAHGFVVRLGGEDVVGVHRHLRVAPECLATLNQPAVPVGHLAVPGEGEDLGPRDDGCFGIARRLMEAEEFEQGRATDRRGRGVAARRSIEKLDGQRLLIQALRGQPAGGVEQARGTRAVGLKRGFRGPGFDEGLDLPLHEQVPGVGVADGADLPIDGQRGLEGGPGLVRPPELFQQVAAFDLDPG